MCILCAYACVYICMFRMFLYILYDLCITFLFFITFVYPAYFVFVSYVWHLLCFLTSFDFFWYFYISAAFFRSFWQFSDRFYVLHFLHFCILFEHVKFWSCLHRTGPGDTMFGFSAKNDVGYTNYRPNRRHGRPFYEIHKCYKSL